MFNDPIFETVQFSCRFINYYLTRSIYNDLISAPLVETITGYIIQPKPPCLILMFFFLFIYFIFYLYYYAILHRVHQSCRSRIHSYLYFVLTIRRTVNHIIIVSKRDLYISILCIFRCLSYYVIIIMKYLIRLIDAQ